MCFRMSTMSEKFILQISHWKRNFSPSWKSIGWWRCMCERKASIEFSDAAQQMHRIKSLRMISACIHITWSFNWSSVHDVCLQCWQLNPISLDLQGWYAVSTCSFMWFLQINDEDNLMILFLKKKTWFSFTEQSPVSLKSHYRIRRFQPSQLASACYADAFAEFLNSRKFLYIYGSGTSPVWWRIHEFYSYDLSMRA